MKLLPLFSLPVEIPAIQGQMETQVRQTMEQLAMLCDKRMAYYKGFQQFSSSAHGGRMPAAV